MGKYTDWEFEDNNKHNKSFKYRLDKQKYCKKNRLAKKKYGPHVYDQDGKYCDRCGHTKKVRKINYENGYE
jgi:hypothetical protein